MLFRLKFDNPLGLSSGEVPDNVVLSIRKDAFGEADPSKVKGFTDKWDKDEVIKG